MADKTDIYHKPMFTIGVVAELAGVHPQTLRSYEQKGLVTPKRTGGNTRMYSQADIDRLLLINELTDEGINLAGVMRILTLQSKLDEAEEAVAIYEEKLNSMHEKIKRISAHVRELGPVSGASKVSNSNALARIDDLSSGISFYLSN